MALEMANPPRQPSSFMEAVRSLLPIPFIPWQKPPSSPLTPTQTDAPSLTLRTDNLPPTPPATESQTPSPRLVSKRKAEDDGHGVHEGYDVPDFSLNGCKRVKEDDGPKRLPINTESYKTDSPNLLRIEDAKPFYPAKKATKSSGADIFGAALQRRAQQGSYFPALSAKRARRARSMRSPDIMIKSCIRKRPEPKTPPLWELKRLKEEQFRASIEKRQKDLQARLSEQKFRRSLAKSGFEDPELLGLKLDLQIKDENVEFRNYSRIKSDNEEIKKKIAEYLESQKAPKVEIDEAPQLSSDQLAKAQKIFRSPHGFNSPALPSLNGMSVNGRDLSMLAPRQWLNDNIIDYYLGMVSDRANKGLPQKKVHAFSTFFYKNLKEGGHNKVRRWAKRGGVEGKKIAQLDFIFVPINVHGNHWTLAVVDFKKKEIVYYDSMAGSMSDVFTNLREYLKAESQGALDLKDWKDVTMGNNGPQQNNSYDCGVFACSTAEALSRGKFPGFSGPDGNLLRHKMVLEILAGRLSK